MVWVVEKECMYVWAGRQVGERVSWMSGCVGSGCFFGARVGVVEGELGESFLGAPRSIGS